MKKFFEDVGHCSLVSCTGESPNGGPIPPQLHWSEACTARICAVVSDTECTTAPLIFENEILDQQLACAVVHILRFCFL